MRETARPSPEGKAGWLGEIVKNTRLVWRLLSDGRVSTGLKLLAPGLALGYLFFPADLLPDFVPVLGQLDDLALLALGMRLFIQMAPAGIVQEHLNKINGRRPDRRSTAEGPVVEGEYRIIE